MRSLMKLVFYECVARPVSLSLWLQFVQTARFLHRLWGAKCKPAKGLDIMIRSRSALERAALTAPIVCGARASASIEQNSTTIRAPDCERDPNTLIVDKHESSVRREARAGELV